MRVLLAAILAQVLVSAAILPDTIGLYQRTAASQPAVADRALWGEYGLQESEAATYEHEGAKFTLTAWRLQDTTGALAAFDWQRPKESTPAKLAALAAETPADLLLVHGNYVLRFSGYKPVPAELDGLRDALKNVDTTSLPSLPGFLPSDNLVPNSERYITGPTALQRFVQAIPPSVAAFHLGAEAELGVFHTPKGDMTLAIFSYPTHQIAMQKIADFEKVPGAMAKRSGPLIAVVLAPPDADSAERLLGQVRYQAQVTRDERIPTRKDNIGDLIINIFILIGILLAFTVVSGLALAGVRAFLRRGGRGEEADAVITLHLEERRPAP